MLIHHTFFAFFATPDSASVQLTSNDAFCRASSSGVTTMETFTSDSLS